jgi:hypothetical protein
VLAFWTPEFSETKEAQLRHSLEIIDAIFAIYLLGSFLFRHGAPFLMTRIAAVAKG